jgi:hypothetical protein
MNAFIKITLSLFFSLALSELIAQNYSISGFVIDSSTFEAIPFAKISTNNNTCGCISTIEGRFKLICENPILSLKVNSFGYQPFKIEIKDSSTNLKLFLSPVVQLIDEVVVLPKENPADIILKKVFENRKKNQPESVSFTYKSYNKIYWTGQLDSTIYNNPEKMNELDEDTKKSLNILEKHHLFMTETVSERFFLHEGKKNKEVVLASRNSGFKNPIINITPTQFQPFSFYETFVSLWEVDYHGIVARNATDKYLFIIQDTTVNDLDTTISITFRPKTGKSFKGLKGTVWINISDFAIEQVISEPADKQKKTQIHMTVNQLYKKIDSKHWFPVELYARITLGSSPLSTDISNHIISSTYLEEIKINPPLNKKDFNEIEVELHRDFSSKKEEYWAENRKDNLTEKEEETYQALDSISKAEKLEKKMYWMLAPMNGKIAFGKYLNADIDKFIGYNEYEGWRLGTGLSTSKKMSEWFRMSGYGAYGIRDQNFKYGGGVHFTLSKKRQAEISLFYKNDVQQDGVSLMHSIYSNPMLNDKNPPSFFANRYNRHEKYGISNSFRAFKSFHFFASGYHQFYQLFDDYFFKKEPTSDEVRRFSNIEILVGFRFQYKEKFMLTQNSLVSMGSNWPIVWLQYSMSRMESKISPFTYSKLDFRIEQRRRIKGLGSFSYRINAGNIDGSVPLNFHYNIISTNSFDNSNWVYVGGNAFETMGINEFYASQYVATHLKFETTSLFHGKRFRPQVGLMHNMLIGNFKNREQHQNVSFSSPDKGYFESGIALNNILRSNISGIGIGFFYRYGHYQLPNERNNLVLKFLVTLSLD